MEGDSFFNNNQMGGASFVNNNQMGGASFGDLKQSQHQENK